MTKPDYTTLPEQVKLEDTVAEVDTRAVPDPSGGQNSDEQFVLRHAAG